MNLPMQVAVKETETYMGETYTLELREIYRHGGDVKVWCWEVTSGPAKGTYGGKQNRKAEARKWARHAIREIGPERAREMAALEAKRAAGATA